MKAALIDTIDVHNTLGEGVVWDKRSQCVWWTDIQQSTLYRLRYPCREPSRDLQSFTTPERLCCFALTDNEETLLAGFASGLALFDVATGKCRWLARPDEVKPGSGRRLNDGRMDRQGRFWVGAMVEDEALAGNNSASLYCLDNSGQLSVHKSGIQISNGICWSPDNQQFYFADSPRQRILSYNYDLATGAISSPEPFANTPQNQFPDGAVVDSQGYLWSAHWGGGCVVRYSPQGAVDQIIKTPASQPSCVGFGGPNMTTLFITSARQDLSPQQLQNDPEAGNLFVVETSVQGIEEPVYSNIHSE